MRARLKWHRQGLKLHGASLSIKKNLDKGAWGAREFFFQVKGPHVSAEAFRLKEIINKAINCNLNILISISPMCSLKISGSEPL